MSIIHCLFLRAHSITCQSVGKVRFTGMMMFWILHLVLYCVVLFLLLRTGWLKFV